MKELDKMLERYWIFDIEKFVKDIPDRRQRLADAKEALTEIAQVKSPNFGSPPGTPGRGDCVFAAAGKAEQLEKEIAHWQLVVDLYEDAEKKLSDEQKTVIRYFFHEPGATSSNIRFLCNKLHYERTVVYKIRREALERLKKCIGV